MFARIGLLALGALACTGAPTTPAAPDKPTVPGPTSDAANRSAAWQPAWPVPGGVAVPVGTAGLLMSGDGSSVLGAGQPCGEGWVKVPGEGVLVYAGAEAEAFRKTPVVTAALVERASWRLADVLGEEAGVAPGGGEVPDPALYRGIQVRSVRKTRRNGAPWQVIVGEWRDQVLVALTDRDNAHLLDGARLQRTQKGLLPVATLPAHDLDSDGHNELVVYGDGDRVGFRAVYRLDLQRAGLELLTFEERPKLACDEAP